MYTFRIIEEKRENTKMPFSQIIENHELGDSYSVLEKGVTPEFDIFMDAKFNGIDKSKVRKLVLGSNERMFFILENEENYVNTYYVMTDGGKTLEKL